MLNTSKFNALTIFGGVLLRGKEASVRLRLVSDKTSERRSEVGLIESEVHYGK